MRFKGDDILYYFRARALFHPGFDWADCEDELFERSCETFNETHRYLKAHARAGRLFRAERDHQAGRRR